MDELSYMKQLVREYLDLNLSNFTELSANEIKTVHDRLHEVWEELKELSGYED